MEKKMKSDYLAPMVEVISVEVESGFAASQLEKPVEGSGEW